MDKSTVKDKASFFSRMREWIQLFVMVFVAGWGSYEFIVKDIIQPTQKPTALDIVASMENIGQKNQNILIRVHTIAYNPTDRRVYVPAYWFTVRGHRLSNSTGQVNTNHNLILTNLRGSELISTYSPIESSEVVAQQRIIYANDAWWEPEDKTNDEAIFAIPEGEFDFLELRVNWIQTRDSSVLSDTIWYALEDGGWEAEFKFKEAGLNYDEQIATGIGYNWNITTLSLWGLQLKEDEVPVVKSFK